MREFSLKTYINNKYVDSLITFHAEHGIVTVSYEAGGEKIIKQDAYPFLALVAIRKELDVNSCHVHPVFLDVHPPLGRGNKVRA